MRNLKRTLSLALASVMLVGMMSVGASAVNASDFTDADEIVNKDAVSTMTALGIINGKEDGSYFDPTGNVTRAEMAKMLCVAINGGVDPVLGVKDTPMISASGAGTRIPCGCTKPSAKCRSLSIIAFGGSCGSSPRFGCATAGITAVSLRRIASARRTGRVGGVSFNSISCAVMPSGVFAVPLKRAWQRTACTWILTALPIRSPLM